MLNWEFSDNARAEEWNPQLLKFGDAGVFQSFEWGQYKQSQGWLPLRGVARDKGGRVSAMAQILVKSLPGGLRICWAPGGPTFLSSAYHERLLPDAMSGLKEAISKKYKRFFLRLNSYVPKTADYSCLLSEEMTSPYMRLNSGFSVVQDLTPSVELYRKGMTSKHRYYLKQAEKNVFQWAVSTDDAAVDSLVQLHEEMEALKGLKNIGVRSSELRKLRSELPQNTFVLSGSLDGKLLCACMVLHFGKKSFYHTAASGQQAREVSAPYAMMAHLYEVLKAQGLEELDLGGIAPGSPTGAGVSHFKRGFGGQIVEYLGEWECSKPGSVRYIANPAMLWRMRRA